MPLVKKFFKFATPSVISMWIFSLYTIVDGIFVARGVGPDALAAVNLAAPFTALVFSVGLTLATGTSTLVAAALGAGEEKRANQLFNQNLAVCAVLSLLITAVSLPGLDSVVRFLGAGEVTLAYTKEYVGVIAGFAIFFVLSYNLEVLVKVEGAPHISAIGVTCCALMNVVLDYVFVMRFGWGVTGAAVATGLAQVTSTVILATYLLVKGKRLRFERFRPRLSVYKRIVPVGLGDGVTELSNGVVIFLFNRTILSIIGEAGIVSYTVVSYVNTLVLMTMSGLAQGIQPLVSFYRGRGDRRSIHRLLRYGITAVALCAALFFGVSQVGARGIVGLFFGAEDTGLIDHTIVALRLFSTAFLLVGFNVLMAGFFAAMEQPGFSLTISLGRGLVLLAASLMVLSAVFGERGIWLSPAVSEALCLVPTIWFSLRYRQSLTKNREYGPIGRSGGKSPDVLGDSR